jgi:Na+/melibiose symporter-like transporter
MLRVGPGSTYLLDVLPAVIVFGLGIALLVAPLTATALTSAKAQHAGVASGVNNAVARAAGLIAVAVLPAAAGLSGDDYTDPVAFDRGFGTALVVAAVLLVAAGVLAWVTISNDVLDMDTNTDANTDANVDAPSAGAPADAAVPATVSLSHCAVDGPPLVATRDLR